MPYKDSEKRRAFHREYEKTRRAVDPEFRRKANEQHKRWRKRNSRHVRDYKRDHWRKINLPVPTRPEPEFCEGCGRLSDRLCLDHDHTTGKFRGWLCRHCNLGLGYFGDNLSGIEGILNYLRRAP